MRMSPLAALWAALLSVPLLAQQGASPSPLSYAEIAARARPAPGLLEAEATLAEARHALASTRRGLREGASLGASTGPRRGANGAVTADRAVDLDLALFLDAPVRREAERTLGEVEDALRAAPQLDLAHRLRRAYLEAWLEGRVLALRRLDLETVEAWLSAARARYEAGADPAFQVSLVEGEIAKARLEVDESRQRAVEAWGALRALADLPPEPKPLADPDPPGVAAPAKGTELEARFASGTLRRALLARQELEERSVRLRDAVALSRWGVRAGLAREGEDTFGRVGFVVRLNRPGEPEALRQVSEAALSASRRTTEVALAELDTRFRSARERLETASPPESPEAFASAIRAVGFRLQEGKERPSDALPIRRQLLEAQIVSLRRQHALHLAAAEIELLTAGGQP